MNENSITVVGTLGRDPELRYTTSGRGVTSFSLAINRRWKNKTTDEWDEETTWLNVVAWGDLGENVAASLTKGNRAIVNGRISVRSYDDREGNTKYITEIVADNIGAELRFASAVVERTERDKAPRQQTVYGDEEPF